MQRQDSFKNQEMIVKFLNFCATMIQKNVKGFIQRQRHKIIMMHIRRFKAVLNGFIQGYRIRQIMKVPDVAKMKQNILETDDGSNEYSNILAYGNPLIRQKKIKLIKMIEGYMNNGQYYKKLKKSKSSKKQFTTNWQENEFVNDPQVNYYQQPLYDEHIQNEYLEQYDQQYEQPQESMLERYSNVRNKQNYYQQAQDDRPITSKGKYDANNAPQENEFAQYESEQPIMKKKNRVAEKPSYGAKKKGNQALEDERPIGAKGTYNNEQPSYSNYEEDRPIGAKGQYNIPEDDRPVGGKGTYGDFDDDRPLGAKGTYGDFDDRPLGAKGTYGDFDDLPLGGKGKYDEFEDEQPKQQPKPMKKKMEPKKKAVKQPQEQAKPYEDQNEPPSITDYEEPQDQDNKKKKKKDPKLLENLKKRTKYDPRKAIQQAKQKQEEQMMQEQAESEIKQEIEEKQMPKEKTKQVQSQQVLPDKLPRSVTPTKLNLSATQDKSTPAKDQVGECSPKEDPFQDSKPKNFLKRKSKQIPLNNPKVDPKQVKSKVKNCWNGTNNMDDQDIDAMEECPQSPKVNHINKSPQRKFEQKQQQQDQPIQNTQLPQQNKLTAPIHVQVQLPQQQYQPQSIQQQKRVIQIEELERAYNSNYSQKFETTMKNLKSLVEERLQHPDGVPIITTRSRFFTAFKVNDFERLLAQLEDQYNRLQVSK